MLWSSSEFGFCELPDAWSSGSSIMPQKKNPDAAELLRAKAPRVVGHLAALHGVIHALPLTYNKDLQEDKEHLFDAVDTLELSLAAARGMIEGVRFDRERMGEAASDEMVAALRVGEATTWLAVHANHPREFTDRARDACARIVDAGIPMVSQSVLLRGVNDDIATLGGLMRAFVECRVKPYYLHHGDLAPGTAHLRTTVADGQALMRALRGRFSGLCQPDYVLDIPGGYGKAPVGPRYLTQADASQECEHPRESRYRILDYCGDVHLYPPVT